MATPGSDHERRVADHEVEAAPGAPAPTMSPASSSTSTPDSAGRGGREAQRAVGQVGRGHRAGRAWTGAGPALRSRYRDRARCPPWSARSPGPAWSRPRRRRARGRRAAARGGHPRRGRRPPTSRRRTVRGRRRPGSRRPRAPGCRPRATARSGSAAATGSTGSILPQTNSRMSVASGSRSTVDRRAARKSPRRMRGGGGRPDPDGDPGAGVPGGDQRRAETGDPGGVKQCVHAPILQVPRPWRGPPEVR